ncbi:MAG: GGDEF domain-containing protein [Betaproteobacteria bacterium]
MFWTNAAVVHHALKQLPQALEAASRALALLGRFEEPDLHVVCRGNALTIRVALALQAEPLERDALLHGVAGLEAWLHDCIAQGRHHLVPESAEAVAEAFVALGEREQARAWLERGVASARGVGAGPAQGQIEVRLARLDRLAGAHASAGEHLALAFELLDEGQSQDALSSVHLEQSCLFEAREDWRGALASFKHHARLREAALEAQADIRTQAMAMRLELERSRLDAELLRRHNEELQTSVSQLSDEAGEFRRQAMEDPLTGLANRRQMEAGVAQLARQYPDTPQMLLIADIDHFKRINDTWSDAVGDDVLKAFAGLLRAQSRPHDVLARIGGEEFVVALGGAVSMTRALLVAERLRGAIEAHAWDGLQAGLRVTASIGVAARAPGEPLNEALKRADAALYECKRSGRNQVRCAS